MIMAKVSQFKTLVILDLETTGLVYDEPKITELAMIAVQMYVPTCFIYVLFVIIRYCLDQH